MAKALKQYLPMEALIIGSCYEETRFMSSFINK